MQRRNNSQDNTIIQVGVVALGLVVVSNLFDKGPADENLDDIDGGDDEKERPTMTVQQFGILADIMDQALLGGVTEDEDAIYGVLGQLRVNADFYALQKAFGFRCWYGMPGNCGTMVHWLTMYLSPSERARCNAIMSERGLTVAI